MVESEARFVWRQLLYLLKLPFLFLLVLARRRPFSALTAPIGELCAFVLEAKATAFLILLNVAVFAFEAFVLAPTELERWVFEPSQLRTWNFGPMAASWFMHASLLHLGGNMLALFIFGRVVEGAVGAARFLLIYLGSALFSSLASALFGEGGIGASGAIAGVIAAGLLLRPFAWTFLVGGIPLPLMVVGWSAIAADVFWLLRPRADNIGHYAHLGGFASILFLMFILSPKSRNELKKGFWINVASLAILGRLLMWLHR